MEQICTYLFVACYIWRHDGDTFFALLASPNGGYCNSVFLAVSMNKLLNIKSNWQYLRHQMVWYLVFLSPPSTFSIYHTEAILQTQFSNILHSMKMFVFSFRCQWNLCEWVQYGGRILELAGAPFWLFVKDAINLIQRNLANVIEKHSKSQSNWMKTLSIWRNFNWGVGLFLVCWKDLGIQWHHKSIVMALIAGYSIVYSTAR